MEKISDISQSKRLKACGINIKTKYQTGRGIRERNTDQSFNQDVDHGIRIEKLYYRKGEVIHRRKNFDSRILYTFVSDPEDERPFACPNCGAVSKRSEAQEGCPYCGTFWNMEYSHKDLGTKYTYDRTMKGSHYINTTLIVSLVISMIVSWIYISATGRTFNGYDIAKVIALGITLCAVFFCIFYYLDALIVLWPIKCYKDRLNRLQMEFWKSMESRGIVKDKFYNNFNYEISNYFFRKHTDIIDYDILDYNRLEQSDKNGTLEVRVNATICLIYFNNQTGKIRESTDKMDFVLAYKGISDITLEGGLNEITCRNCGASIDVTAGKCPYCDTVYHSFQEWFLVSCSE